MKTFPDACMEPTRPGGPLGPDTWRQIGGLWPNGVQVAQSWLEIGAVLMTVQQHQVVRVLEIGTHRGGLASLLAARTLFSWTPFEALTVEINAALLAPKTRVDLASTTGLALRLQDCFGDAFLAEAREFVARPGLTLVYCDGGDKPREVLTFAPLLKPGDLIAAHDYAPGKPGHGPGAEITDADLVGLGPDFQRLQPWWLESCSICLLTRQ